MVLLLFPSLATAVYIVAKERIISSFTLMRVKIVGFFFPQPYIPARVCLDKQISRQADSDSTVKIREMDSTDMINKRTNYKREIKNWWNRAVNTIASPR